MLSPFHNIQPKETTTKDWVYLHGKTRIPYIETIVIQLSNLHVQSYVTGDNTNVTSFALTVEGGTLEVSAEEVTLPEEVETEKQFKNANDALLWVRKELVSPSLYGTCHKIE